MEASTAKMSGLRVLVVGASVAGPATAYWLAKAGARVTVIERFPSLRMGGQAIDIRTAGVSVMRKMTGMEDLVRAHSTQEEGVSFVRNDGRPYGIIRSTGNANRQSIVSEYEIFRDDLSKILFDLTQNRDNIRYVFGEQLASIQQSSNDGKSVTVEFANGLPNAEFDLVVACDGATSRTRAMALQCNIRDHVLPINAWAAYFSIEQDLLQGSKISQGYSAVGGRFVSVGPDPAGGNRAMLMSIHPRGDRNAMLPFREASSQGEHALKDYVAHHFRDGVWKNETILQAMMESKDFYASEIVQVKVPNLSNGRFVLVGDAGYAAGPTGGGTSLALTGAYILAGEIRKHAGDLDAGLKAYEDRMRLIIAELQKIPPFTPDLMAPQTKWAILLRNYIFAFLAWSKLAEVALKYLGPAFADTDTFPLPEYEWAAE